VRIPTTGTSRVKGATVEAGWRDSSQYQTPYPKKVETTTT